MPLPAQLPLEPFAGRFQTADGYDILAGGLCPAGSRTTALQALSALEQCSLGPSRDCVVIDVCLSRILCRCAPENVRFLAASVFVPNAPELCGGVAGDIACEESSADGDFAKLAENVFGFALPGAGAMLFTGEEAEARRLHSLALTALRTLPLSQEHIDVFLGLALPCSGRFLFVTDGSGGSAGCMAAQSDGQCSVLWLPTSPTQNSFQRGDCHGRS